MLIGIDAHSLEGKRTGVGRVLFNLLKEWMEWANCESLIANRSLKFILYFKDEIPEDVPHADFFKFKLLKVSSNAKFIHWDLCWAAKKDKVDVLFCPGYVAPIFYPGKIALTLHDIFYEAHPQYFNWQSPADRILLKWVSKKSAQKARVIFVPSEFTKKEVMRLYRVSEEKIVLAPLAVDETLGYANGNTNLTQIMRMESKSPLTPLYKGGKEEEVLYKRERRGNFGFFVGSIFNRRHLPEIINAFSRLAKEYQDLQFLISGKDNTGKKNIDFLIERANKELGRQAIRRVDFVTDSDLKLLYSASAFFIYLSDYEGFGLPPLEAMSGGTPVITSDSTSLREIAGEATLLIKNNSDIEEIYQAMKRLMDDENLRKELVQKGGEQAAKFSWKDCAQKTLKALIKISNF